MTAVPIRETIMSAYLTDADLPVWVKVGFLAWSRTVNGHTRLGTGELAKVLGVSSVAASQALAVARRRGLVDACSTSRCLVLPGCALRPCEERHR